MNLTFNLESGMEANWWLIGFFAVCTLAGLYELFGWWWTLGIPVAILYDWLSSK
jgi:hypothetical protein